MLTLAEFLSKLKDRLGPIREARKTRIALQAPAFTTFDYIDPDERLLSQMFADLLRPTGTHGQGALFLRKFLQRVAPGLAISEVDLAQAQVTPEARTLYLPRNRAIDILIEVGPPGLLSGVGIENKPSAREQYQQLADYQEHLRKKYGEGGYYLVYLSGSGRLPTSLGQADRIRLEGENRFQMLNLAVDIPGWLKGCLRECRSAKVSDFLEDLSNYLTSTFGVHEMTRDDEVVSELAQYLEHALVSADYLAMALGFARVNGQLRQKVITEFLNKLAVRVLSDLGGKAHGWEVQDRDNMELHGVLNWLEVSNSGWGVGGQTSDKIRILLASTQSNRGRYFAEDVGVELMEGSRRFNDSTERNRRILEALAKEFGRRLGSSAQKMYWREEAKRFAHWSSDEVLVELHSTADALGYYSNLICRTARAVESIVNPKPLSTVDDLF